MQWTVGTEKHSYHSIQLTKSFSFTFWLVGVVSARRSFFGVASDENSLKKKKKKTGDEAEVRRNYGE